ncbi:MAG: segregation and condensation protein A, partial [Acidimicrobiales bacterium]
MSFSLSSGEFSGPIGLLTQLVNAQKIDLFEFSLSRLVDDYLAAIADMRERQLEVSTEFLSVASTLIALKARRLVRREDDEDDTLEIPGADEQEILLIRMIESAMFRAASEQFGIRMDTTSRSVGRAVGPEAIHLAGVPDPLESIDPRQLAAHFARLMAQVDEEVIDSSHITIAPIAVAEVGSRLIDAFPDQGVMSFRDLVGFADSRYEVVVCFVLILEAFRAGLVEIAGEDGVQVERR